MFGIQRNGVFLKLKEDTRLTTTIYSQLINENKLKGALTIPIEAPIEGNETFFENISILKLVNSGARLKAGLEAVKVYIEGVWWLYGKAAILGVKENTISLNLIVGLPGISSLDDKLQDLDWGTISLPTDVDITTDLNLKLAWLNNYTGYSYDKNTTAKTFNFPPVYNPDFYGGENADFEGVINSYIAYGVNSYLGNKFYNKNAMVPMVYMLEILRKGFEKGGFIFDWSNLPNVFEKLIEINNYDFARRITNVFSLKAGGAAFTLEAPYTGFPVIFINDSIPPNFDMSDLYDNVLGEYSVERAGRYRIKYNLPWSTRDQFGGASAGITTSFGVHVVLDATTMDSEYYQHVGEPASGIAAKRVYLDLTEADIGKKIKIQASFNYIPTSVVLFYVDVDSVDMELQIDLIDAPTINRFANVIDLSKCVPQDILFRDYVNAFAGTFNVEFDVNENSKIVTAILNEPSIVDGPTEKTSLWVKDGTKPTVELRPAKYNKFSYDWKGSDSLVSDNFKPVDPLLYLGEFGSFFNLNNDYPPDIDVVGKIGKVWNEVCFYVCNYDENTNEYSWVYYSDDYAPYSIGEDGATYGMPISPLFMRHRVFTNFTMPIPAMNLVGNSEYFKINNKDVGLRTIFYIGNCVFPLDIGGSTNAPYSTVTNYPFTKTGDAFTSTTGFSFEYNREYIGANQGIFNSWKYSLQAMNLIRLVTKKLDMSMYDLLAWSFRKRLAMNGAVFMPEQITISTSLTEPGIIVEGELGIEEVELL